MGAYELRELKTTRDLIAVAHGEPDPVVVFDGDDECLVAMTPGLFERILFEGGVLSMVERSSLRI